MSFTTSAWTKLAKKVSDHLLDLGLVRTQYSVFLGTVDKNRLDELVLFAESQLDATDKLYVIPVQRDDLSAARIVGLGFDEISDRRDFDEGDLVETLRYTPAVAAKRR